MSIDDTTRPALDLGYETPGPLRIVLDPAFGGAGIHDRLPDGDAREAGDPWDVDDDPWLDEDDEPPVPGTTEGVLWVLLAVVAGQAVGLWGCDGTLRCTARACVQLGLAPPDDTWSRRGLGCDCAVWAAVLGPPGVPTRWPSHFGDAAADPPPS